MEKNKGFAFYENYWTSIERLSEDQQKEVCYAIAKYGITNEMVDPVKYPLGYAMTQSMIISLNNSISNFNRNSESGKKGGRPSSIDADELKQYLIDNPKATAEQTAAFFEVSKSTIDKHQIWKNRKNLVNTSNNVVFDF